jgi:putative oxidoreductase|tara:strand:- start:255 stop:719 length:465 start_codon:yes stop_codon:yes gene_type:complete
MFKLKYQFTDFLFRALFSLIFIGLGFEHIFQDAQIQSMMPAWLPLKRLISLSVGLLLLTGGFSLLCGYKVKLGAVILGIFLVIVSLTIHLPALAQIPQDLPQDWHWLWNVYQRSNLFKNLCLLGGCFQLANHRIGRFSVEHYLMKREKTDTNQV